MTERFSELLPIERLGEDRFAVTPPGSGFLFGGLSMAAILRGAAETVDDGKVPMSLHTTFLANGDWGGPHDIGVQRISDSRSLAVRRVNMVTGGKLAIVAEAVFHRPEPSDDWQAAPWLEAPAPETLTPFPEKLQMRVIDVRPAAPMADKAERIHPYWARTLERLDDPIQIACALAFISDFWVYASPFEAGSGRSDGLLSRTYSHTLVFHRPLPDGWWWFDCEPLSLAGGRFLSRGSAQAPDGTLLASFIQQGVVRPLR